jgi:hypothetical protein
MGTLMLASLSAPFGEPSPMEVRFEAQTGQQMLKASLPLVTQLGRRLFNASSSAFDPLRTSINPKHPCEGIIQLLKSTCVPIGGNAPTRRQIFAPTVSPRVE